MGSNAAETVQRHDNGKLKKGAQLGTMPKMKTRKHGLLLAKDQAIEAAPRLIKVLIEQAELGDVTAAKTVLGFVLPQLKSVEHKGLDPAKLPRMVVDMGEIIDAEEVEKPSAPPGNTPQVIEK